MNPLVKAFHLLPDIAQDRVRKMTYSLRQPPHTPLDTTELIYINPSRIVYCAQSWRDNPNWDKLTQRFDEYDFYQAAKERWSGLRLDWKKTEFYARCMRENTYRGDLDKRCSQWDRMFQNIRDEGYQESKCVPNHITVGIGRYGDILFIDGGHRLTAVKVLELGGTSLGSIPVEVVIRHPQWEEFRGRVGGYVERTGMVYAPLLHPDLSHTPYSHGPERFEMINKAMGKGMKSVLDIGAHWGYFCHRFEELGYECTAVESAPDHLYFLNKLKRADDREFLIHPMDVLSLGKGAVGWKFDVVLALAVFHHFLKTNRLEQLKGLLGKLECKEMYFQSHRDGESQMDELAPNEYMAPEEFVRWILEHSCLNNAQQIGVTSDDGRGIWRLWV